MLRTIVLLPLVFALNVLPASADGASLIRFEQDDPSVVYSGNWYSNDSVSHSRGAAALTNAPGARATISFIGTAITWVG